MEFLSQCICYIIELLTFSFASQTKVLYQWAMAKFHEDSLTRRPFYCVVHTFVTLKTIAEHVPNKPKIHRATLSTHKLEEVTIVELKR